MNEWVPDGLYEKLVEDAGDVILALDEHGEVTFVNSRVQHYPGFTASEIIGRNFAQFVHPDDLLPIAEKLKLAYLGTPVVDHHFRIAMPDGGYSHWIANGAAVDLGGRRLLTFICRDVSESEHLKEKLVQRNDALAALGRIAVALSTCTDLDQALSEALDQILSALGLSVGAIVLRDAGGRVRLGASSRPDLESLTNQLVASEKLIAIECMRRGERVFLPDASADDVDPLLRELCKALGAGAAVAIPLLTKETARSSLTLGLQPGDTLSAEQDEFLQLVAGILGPAIENAALHADLTDRVNRLAMLERLAKSANAGRDVETVLESCMREIAILVPYDMGVVVLFRQGAEAEVFPFSKGGGLLATRSMGLNTFHMERIANLSGPTIVPEEMLGKFHSDPDTFHVDAGSAAVVPLVRMGEKVGLLKLWSQEPNRYGQRELDILAAAAEHLSIAASNAAMYQTEQQRSLELAASAQEVRHRIKNNLQMISGLLEISGSDNQSGARTVHRCLRQVRAISTIHDLLSQEVSSGRITLRECLVRIAENAVRATGRADEIELSISGEDCSVTSDAATAIGVMVNELVSNAIEHGLGGQRKGRIDILVSQADTIYCVEVIDDGVGLPEDFRTPEPTGSPRGLGLVSSLAAYGLGGKLEIERLERGTCARISVKGARSGIAGIGS